MIKNNPIIKATLVLFAFIYICLAIYMLTQGVSILKLLDSFLNSSFLIIGGTLLGFCITLVVISASKNYQLNLLLKANNNGRYGTTQGYLPKRHVLDFEKLSLKNDLPETLQTWVKTYEATNKPTIELFITIAGILKARLNLYVAGSSSITLYAHSIKVAEKLAELNISGAQACNEFLIAKGYLSPNNMKMKYIEELLASQALPLIGIMHDIGKVTAFIKQDGITTYLDNYPQKSKLIASALDCFWELPENIRDSLLFAAAYYNDLQNCPKTIVDKKLLPKYVMGELLIQLLIAVHNEVASYETIQYTPVQVKSIPSQINHEQTNDESEVKLAINVTPSQDEILIIPKPKKRNATKNQEGAQVAKEMTNKKITTQNSNPVVRQTTAAKIDDKIALDKLFKHSNKSTTKVPTNKKNTGDETVKLSEVFGADHDK